MAVSAPSGAVVPLPVSASAGEPAAALSRRDSTGAPLPPREPVGFEAGVTLGASLMGTTIAPAGAVAVSFVRPRRMLVPALAAFAVGAHTTPVGPGEASWSRLGIAAFAGLRRSWGRTWVEARGGIALSALRISGRSFPINDLGTTFDPGAPLGFRLGLRTQAVTWWIEAQAIVRPRGQVVHLAENLVDPSCRERRVLLVWGFPTLGACNVSGASGMRSSGFPLSTRAQTSAPPPVGHDAAEVDIASLYRDYATKVGRWAARLGGPAVEVEDVVQEVFLVASRRLRRFRPDGGTATTWLFRTTERIVKAARRKQRVRRLFTWPSSASPPGAGVAGAIPSDELERRQEIERVYRVLDCLPERQRRVLILFELEGLSTADIATLVGARVGTVRVWLFRARAEFLRRHESVNSGRSKGAKTRMSTDWHPGTRTLV